MNPFSNIKTPPRPTPPPMRDKLDTLDGVVEEILDNLPIDLVNEKIVDEEDIVFDADRPSDERITLPWIELDDARLMDVIALRGL